jgi:guanylate kinase
MRDIDPDSVDIENLKNSKGLRFIVDPDTLLDTNVLDWVKAIAIASKIQAKPEIILSPDNRNFNNLEKIVSSLKKLSNNKQLEAVVKYDEDYPLPTDCLDLSWLGFETKLFTNYKDLTKYLDGKQKPVDFLFFPLALDSDYEYMTKTPGKAVWSSTLLGGAVRDAFIDHSSYDISEMEKFMKSHIVSPMEPGTKSEFTIPKELSSLMAMYQPYLSSNLHVLWGLSGTGKSTMINHLLKYVPNLMKATKFTTRPTRPESKTEDTFHLSENDFRKLINDNKLVGVHDFLGYYYGYSREQIEEAKKIGIDVLLDTSSVSCAEELKERYDAKISMVNLDPKLNQQFLVQRYEQMPFTAKWYENYLKKVKDQRLDLIVNNLNDYERISQLSVNQLPDDVLAYNQARLRNYIVDSRLHRFLVDKLLIRYDFNEEYGIEEMLENMPEGFK